MGEVGFTRPRWPLAVLLRDESSHVRRAALAAAGKVREPDYWPAVIENLASIQTSRTATAALADGGAAAVPFVDQALRRPVEIGDDPGQQTLQRIRAALAARLVDRHR